MIGASWHPKTASWGFGCKWYANKPKRFYIPIGGMLGGRGCGGIGVIHRIDTPVMMVLCFFLSHLPRAAQLCTQSPTYHHRERGGSGGKEGRLKETLFQTLSGRRRERRVVSSQKLRARNHSALIAAETKADQVHKSMQIQDVQSKAVGSIYCCSDI